MNIGLFNKNDHQIELIHYWELERVTRQKGHYQCFFDKEQEKQFIGQLLDSIGLSIEDIQCVWGLTDDFEETHGPTAFPEYYYHSVAHVFSSLLLDNTSFQNEDILTLCVDGGPDTYFDFKKRDTNYYFMGCYSQKGKLNSFPISSPGCLWIKAKRRFSKQEGTLMALASASKSRLYHFPYEVAGLMAEKRGDLHVYETFLESLTRTVESLREEDQTIKFNYFDPDFTQEENKISMAMKIVQKASIEIMVENIKKAIRCFDIDPSKTYLSIVGGYGLNCPTNSYLMEHFQFKGYLAPPCVNDGGIALGKGLYRFYLDDPKIQFHFNSAYYGDADNNLDAVTQSTAFSSFIDKIEAFNLEQVIRDIQHYPIVWFDGRAEIGPRSLGNRSLLGDPRTQLTKDRLNHIKKREWWRPVAPIILENEIQNWFDNGFQSPFMLHTFSVKEEKRNLVPAICHIDHSSRVQTANAKDQPLIYQILHKFHQATGVPLLCNTSLNDKGEPIINKISEAFRFALKKGIPVIYINSNRIRLKNHEQFVDPGSSGIPVDLYNGQEKENVLELLNPYHVPIEQIVKNYTKYDINLLLKYNPMDKYDAKVLTYIIKSQYNDTKRDNHEAIK